MPSKKNHTFRLSEDCQRAIKAAQHLFVSGKTDALNQLIAEGIKSILLNNAKIDPSFLEYLSTDGYCQMFWRYADALLKGEQSSYYLAEPPKEGYWDERGVKGRSVLHRSQSFTPDTISYDHSKADHWPKVPAWLTEEE